MNKIGRLVGVKQEPYTSLITDRSEIRGASALRQEEDILPIDRQLRVDTEFSNETPLPKSPTLALEQVFILIRLIDEFWGS